MTQIKERTLTDAQLDAKEYADFEREYEDWCKKYDINYVVDQEEESEDE